MGPSIAMMIPFGRMVPAWYCWITLAPEFGIDDRQLVRILEAAIGCSDRRLRLELNMRGPALPGQRKREIDNVIVAFVGKELLEIDRCLQWQDLGRAAVRNRERCADPTRDCLMTIEHQLPRKLCELDCGIRRIRCIRIAGRDI